MKYIPARIAVFFLLMISCNKDKYTTEPQVKIKSISPNTVVQGNLIKVKGEFTDDEGDLDSAFIIYKWYNGAAAVFIDTIKDFTITSLNLPPKTRSGDIEISFVYGRNVQGYRTLPFSPVTRDTTSAIGLFVKDKAGHVSNYSESDKIRLKKP